MGFIKWLNDDVSKLSKVVTNPDTIGKAALVLGGLAGVAKFFKEKNDLKNITNDAVEEVMKRLESKK